MKPEGLTIPPSPEPGKPLHDPPLRRNTTFKGDVLRLVTGTGLAGFGVQAEATPYLG